MNTDKNTARFLGAAFLLQAIAPIVGGIFAPVNMLQSSAPDNISDTMTRIANNASGMRASIVSDMVTAMGIAILGTLLFVILRKQNDKIARVAMGLYLVEAALLAAREMLVFSLLYISQESVTAGHTDHLQTLGKMLYESQHFGYSLHMLPFAVGATMFYYLFFQSGYIPRALSLLGLIAAPLALIGILFVLMGQDVPLLVFLPSLPFELITGVWLLTKGVKDQLPATATTS